MLNNARKQRLMREALGNSYDSCGQMPTADRTAGTIATVWFQSVRTRTPTFAAIAVVAVVAVVAAVSSCSQPDVMASNLGDPEAVASPRAPFVPYPVVSAKEYRAFIRQSHERAAREGDPAPLPATF